jgi:hypothetical protein
MEADSIAGHDGNRVRNIRLFRATYPTVVEGYHVIALREGRCLAIPVIRIATQTSDENKGGTRAVDLII